jgi:hypothetical protein
MNILRLITKYNKPINFKITFYIIYLLKLFIKILHINMNIFCNYQNELKKKINFILFFYNIIIPRLSIIFFY